MNRLFGPFCRDFFVPWDQIAVARSTGLLWSWVRLEFGISEEVGTLRIPAHTANRLALAADGRWPEAGPFQEETRRNTLKRLLTQWALITCAAALFFTLVPLAVDPTGRGLPIVPAILLPAIVFGVVTIVRYLRERP
jgi:hypothetical protein